MKRNIILAVVVLLLGGGAFYVYKNRPDKTTSIDRAESNFKIDDPLTIGRIVLTHKNGVRSDLKRVGDKWIINDAYKVRQSNIDFLLTGIQRQTLDHIPNAAATKNILAYMATSGIHVEIFDTKGEEMLNYYVGGVTQDEYGTFFLKEGSAQPYCLVQPGFDGGLRVRYALEPIDWRDVRFWMEDIEKMDSLIVDYPQQRQHAFVITKRTGGYEVSPLYKTTPILKGSNPSLIQSYFTSLNELACEDFLNNAEEKDSIRSLQPFLEMRMIYKDKNAMLRFYPVGKPTSSPFSDPFNRFFIDYVGRDFMIGQYNVIKGAFRSYDYFFAK